MRLKGIHLGIKSGIMAAEVAFDALQKEDYSAVALRSYEEKFHAGWAARELWRVRNFHQPFDKGLFWGMFNVGAQFLTGGRGFTRRIRSKADHLHIIHKGDIDAEGELTPSKFDGVLTFDKLTDVFASGTKHEEHQPSHLRISETDICSSRCIVEYGNPCARFCPAQVYEMVESEGGRKKLQINASNCLHCKTCDIADPYGIITWVPPEGGGGPRYAGM